jgi:hypothetical protein
VLAEEALKWEFNRQTCHPGLLHNLLRFSENIFLCQAFQREQLKPVFIVCYEFDNFMKLVLIADWDGIPTSSCE